MAQVDSGYQYSVEVRSRFALLLDDGTNKVDTKAPTPTAKDAPKVKAVTAPKEKVESATPPTQSTTTTRGRGTGQRGGGRQFYNQENQVPAEEYSRPQRGQGGGYRGAGRGARGGRGSYNGYNNSEVEPSNEDLAHESNRPNHPRGGHRGRGYGDHRDFDRRSGSDKTSIKPVIKREGYGHGNWGTVQDEIDATMEPVVEVEADVGDVSTEVIPDETIIKPEESIEEAQLITLNEWKAMKKANKQSVVLAGTGVRKPNDGKDVFKNMVPHQKLVVVPDEGETEAEQVVDTKNDASFIEFGFSDRRGRGERGSRGTYRGAGREDGYRENNYRDIRLDSSDGYRRGRGGMNRGGTDDGREDDGHAFGGRGGGGRGRGRGNYNREYSDVTTGNEATEQSEGESRPRGRGRGGFGGSRGGYREGGNDQFDTDRPRGRGRGRGNFGASRGGYTEEGVTEENGQMDTDTRPRRGRDFEGGSNFDENRRGGRGRGSRGGYRGGGEGGVESFDGETRPRGRGNFGGSRGGFRENSTNQYDGESRPRGRGRGNFGGSYGGGYQEDKSEEGVADGESRPRGRGRGNFSGSRGGYRDGGDDANVEQNDGESRPRGRGRGTFGGYREDRGGRGGPRGRGVDYSRASTTGGSGVSYNPPRIDNDDDFPSLG